MHFMHVQANGLNSSSFRSHLQVGDTKLKLFLTYPQANGTKSISMLAVSQTNCGISTQCVRERSAINTTDKQRLRIKGQRTDVKSDSMKVTF